MTTKTKVWLSASVFAFLFAVACNGQAADAIRSRVSAIPSGGISFSPSISLPTPSIEAPTEAPTDEPTEAPTEEPTEAPTEAPTEEPTEAPTAEPTEAPTETPTEEPTQAPTEAPTEEPEATGSTGPNGGSASASTSTTIWWILGILAVVGVIVFLVMRSRRGPSVTLEQAYAASAAVRDRLSQEVSAPSSAPSTLESLVAEADRSLRTVEVDAPDDATRAAVAQTLRAMGDVREGLALRSASAGAAHASGSDVESHLLRSLAALTAALGPLRQAVDGTLPPTTGFET